MRNSLKREPILAICSVLSLWAIFNERRNMDSELIRVLSKLSACIAPSFGLEPDDLLSEFYINPYQRIEPQAVGQMTKRHLVAILRNCARDILRREPQQRLRRVASRRSSQLEDDKRHHTSPTIISLSDVSETDKSLTERTVPNLSDWEDILSAIPPEDRHVLDLKFALEMSWPEIAQETGRQREQVKSSFKRQKVFLKQYLQEVLS